MLLTPDWPFVQHPNAWVLDQVPSPFKKVPDEVPNVWFPKLCVSVAPKPVAPAKNAAWAASEFVYVLPMAAPLSCPEKVVIVPACAGALKPKLNVRIAEPTRRPSVLFIRNSSTGAPLQTGI